MNSSEFKKYAYELIDYCANYMDKIKTRQVLPDCSPGYLSKLVPKDPPQQAEKWEAIVKDIEPCIMEGMTHWQHPHFHAYFSSGNSWASIIGDIFSNTVGVIGASWESCPVVTELEMIVVDWCCKFLGLPKFFLSKFSNPESVGGGVIQTSASEGILISLIVAREEAVRKLRKVYPNKKRGELLSMLTAYCSNQCHSCVEKNAAVASVTLRMLDPDDTSTLRGDILRAAIREDMKNGKIPFYCVAILGSTGLCCFDDIYELGPICKRHNMWMHVDGAYAGNSFCCKELRYLIDGFEYAHSFNTNPNKWMMTAFDCSLLWIKEKDKLIDCMSGYDTTLRNKTIVDLRHWTIPMSRRFRAFKLWLVIQSYGVEGIRSYIRRHIQMAKTFEAFVRRDHRFEIIGEIRVGMCCFRLKGPNNLNSRLLDALNHTKKIHMIPSSFKGVYFIRYAICHEYMAFEHVKFGWDMVSEYATVVIRLFEMDTPSAEGLEKLMHSQHRIQKRVDKKTFGYNLESVKEGEELQKAGGAKRDFFVEAMVVAEPEIKSNFVTHMELIDEDSDPEELRNSLLKAENYY